MDTRITRSIIALGVIVTLTLGGIPSTGAAASAGDAQATQAAKLLMLLSICTERAHRAKPEKTATPAPSPAQPVSDEE